MPKKEIKPIVYEVEYGTIKVKLNSIMKRRNISTYELSNKANIRFQTVQALKEDRATRIDFEVLAKLCYVLECEIPDIIEYVSNEKSKK